MDQFGCGLVVADDGAIGLWVDRACWYLQVLLF